MRRGFAPDLYLVTDRRLCATLGVEQVVAEAVAGGVTMVQLRDDETSTGALVDLARRLIELLTPTGVPLLVNNRIEVAAAAAAAGAHVGQADEAPARVRDRLGSAAILGLSITAPEQVAAVDQVDYLGVGPIFATGTKADAAPPMGLAGLAAVRARTRLPIVAIGGIDRTSAASVIGAGADGIAVVSAICAAAEPMVAARDLARLVAEAKSGGVRR
jgi:thiamine-phosphate pyrophosphorylase